MLILGSKSPRRKEILSREGISFEIRVSNAEENIIESNPLIYPIKTAKKKAEEIVINKDEILLCADTIVYSNNKILGKPTNRFDAYQMIKSIQGSCHQVITGVYLKSLTKEKEFSETTYVYVKKMTEKEINDYIDTTEPYDKAGGYAIQGIFGKYIDRIVGDYDNVVGLPITRIKEELKSFEKGYKDE